MTRISTVLKKLHTFLVRIIEVIYDDGIVFVIV